MSPPGLLEVTPIIERISGPRRRAAIFGTHQQQAGPLQPPEILISNDHFFSNLLVVKFIPLGADG